MSLRAVAPLAFVALALASPLAAQPRAIHTVEDRKPDAIVNLRTAEGASLVQATWRYADARIVPVAFRAPGPDRKPSGAPIQTFDIEPRAGAREFDDRAWSTLAPEALEDRKASGRLAFNWYRTQVTLPERVGDLPIDGASVVLEIVVDDYAEVWVDGTLPRTFGQAGSAFHRGYNAANRVVLTTDARPGQQFKIAVFGANGPQSDPPPNFIWIRSATLELFGPSPEGRVADLTVERHDAELDTIVPADVQLRQVAEGFEFVEGPVWHPDGYLLFSDPNRNTIYRYTPGHGVAPFRVKSGYAGPDIGRYHQPGSNGLAIDPDGRLTIDEHGNRRVVRIEPNGVVTVLADRYEGKRLNSPNDLVYRSDGTLFVTDPPFGLPRVFDDPAKELAWSGIYGVKNGIVTLASRDLTGPNGLAFSPDERYLYVGNWDPARKIVMRYEVLADGTLANGRVFFDMTGAPGDEAIDGVKVDAAGHLYVSGPGGLWILSADGRHLGTLRTPELPANFAWGDSDGRSLYLTARTGLYKVRLNIPGAGRAAPAAAVTH
jgi:gluconolactonase